MLQDEFTRHYLAALRWVDMPEDRPDQWVYNSPELVNLAMVDCGQFIASANGLYSPDNAGKAAHDFWLTRQHHGAGFWDSPEIWGRDNADKLTEIAHSFPELSVYIGDDGLLYAQ